MRIDRSYIKKGAFLTGGTSGAFVEPEHTLSEIIRDHAYSVAKIEKMIEEARQKIEALQSKVRQR